MLYDFKFYILIESKTNPSFTKDLLLIAKSRLTDRVPVDSKTPGTGRKTSCHFESPFFKMGLDRQFASGPNLICTCFRSNFS